MVVYRQLLLKDIQTTQVAATHLHLVTKIVPSEVKQQIYKDVTLPLMEEMAEEVKSRYGQRNYFVLLLFFCMHKEQYKENKAQRSAKQLRSDVINALASDCSLLVHTRILLAAMSKRLHGDANGVPF